MPSFNLPFYQAVTKRCSNILLKGGCILLATYLLSACINPPARSTQTQTTPAPNVPVVDASVNTQNITNTTAAAASAANPVSPITSTGSLQGHLLQAGTFSVRSNADAVANAIRNKLPQFANLVQVSERGNNWRVLIGGFANEQLRAQAAQLIRSTTNYDVANAAP